MLLRVTAIDASDSDAAGHLSPSIEASSIQSMGVKGQAASHFPYPVVHTRSQFKAVDHFFRDATYG